MTSVRTYRFPAIDRVVHGAGSIARVPRMLNELSAQRVVVLSGRTLATKTPLVRQLVTAIGARHAGTFAEIRQHAPKNDIDRAVQFCRDVGADCIVGFGGSSVTDAAKIIAVRLLGDELPQRAMPQILIPTTLSAGEYTPASGMTGDVPGIKTYVVDPRMAPFAVVLDPEVTLATPMDLWLSTGVKCLEHACEMMWSPRSHPVATALAREALSIVHHNLPITARDPDDLDARAQCQLAGWMSMSGVSNVQVYLSHTLGHQIGARWGIPHGITSGITLGPVMRHLSTSAPMAMLQIAVALGVADHDTAPSDACLAGAAEIEAFVQQLGLPTRLRDVGAIAADFAEVAVATQAAGHATGFGDGFGAQLIEALLREMW